MYLAVREKLPLKIIHLFIKSQTIDDAIKIIERFNIEVAHTLLSKISQQVEIRSTEYIQKYISSDLKVGVVLFDRDRKIRSISKNSQKMFSKIISL